jgi:hypothetical protein
MALRAEAYPHLGVNIDVDNGRLALHFDDDSSPSDTVNLELPWVESHSCMYRSKCTSPTANRLVPFQPAGNPTTSFIIKVLNQHMPTTTFPHNDNLPQIHTLFAPLFRRFRTSFHQTPSSSARH